MRMPPRFGVSGPIVRGRAWFADNFDGEYDEAIGGGLPGGQNTTSGNEGRHVVFRLRFFGRTTRK